MSITAFLNSRGFDSFEGYSQQVAEQVEDLIHLTHIPLNIMEIGFNAGHSALLMLLSNPTSRLYIFDIMYHSYTKPCFEYLNKQFDNRLTLYEGPSQTLLPKFSDGLLGNSFTGPFDLYHVDGSHDYYLANQDFFNCRDNYISKKTVSFSIHNTTLSTRPPIIIWDDVDQKHLNDLWDGYKKSKHVNEFLLLKNLMYDHAFGFLIK